MGKAKMVDPAALIIPASGSGGEKVHELMVSEEEAPRTLERQGTFRESYYAISSILPEISEGLVEEPALDNEYSSKNEVMDFEGVVELLKNAGYLEKSGSVA